MKRQEIIEELVSLLKSGDDELTTSALYKSYWITTWTARNYICIARAIYDEFKKWKIEWIIEWIESVHEDAEIISDKSFNAWFLLGIFVPILSIPLTGLIYEIWKLL